MTPDPVLRSDDLGDETRGEIWYCAYCPEANVTRSDEDRCCLTCGVDLVERKELLELLGVAEAADYKGMWEVECARTLDALEKQRAAESALASARGLPALWRKQADDYAGQPEATDLAPMGVTCAVAVRLCAGELEAALAPAQPPEPTLLERIDQALAYLTDRDDIESTPLHAIGHAVEILRSVRGAR
jgi:hypothetical protein